MSLIGRLGFQPHDDVGADVVGVGRGRASDVGRGRASEDMISEERKPAQRWESFLPASSRIFKGNTLEWFPGVRTKLAGYAKSASNSKDLILEERMPATHISSSLSSSILASNALLL